MDGVILKYLQIEMLLGRCDDNLSRTDWRLALLKSSMVSIYLNWQDQFVNSASLALFCLMLALWVNALRHSCLSKLCQIKMQCVF